MAPGSTSDLCETLNGFLLGEYFQNTSFDASGIAAVEGAARGFLAIPRCSAFKFMQLNVGLSYILRGAVWRGSRLKFEEELLV